VQDNGGPVAVSQFCAKLYAIKEITSAVGEEMRVGLHHVGKSRVKKEKLDIGITPFTNGMREILYTRNTLILNGRSCGVFKCTI
jgi:hypothetical protein